MRKCSCGGFSDLWSFCGLLTAKGVYKYCVRLRSVFCSVCFVAVRRGSLFGLDWGAKGGICNTYTCLVLEQVFPGALGINIFVLLQDTMYLLRPVFISVVVPEPLMFYLNNMDISVVDFLKTNMSEFLLHILHCVTPVLQAAYCGFTLTSLAPTLEMICCVASPELLPDSELTELICNDLDDFVQLMLRMEIRDRGFEPNVNLLNELQVTREPDLFQP